MLLKQKQIKSNQIGMLILVVAQTRETERVKLDLILLDLTRIDTKDITRTVKIVFFLRNVILLFYSRSYRIFLSSYRKQASNKRCAYYTFSYFLLCVVVVVATVPYRTVPYRTTPHRIASHRFHFISFHFIFVVMGGSTVQ